MNTLVSTTLYIAERIPWEVIYSRVQSVFWALNILLLTAIILVFPKTLQFRPRFTLTTKQKRHSAVSTHEERYRKHWEQITVKAKSAPPHSYTLAIIEADSFVDSILKDLGFEGEHMADRLERADFRDLRSLNNLWRAHKVRNQLVHTPGYDLSVKDAEQYLYSYGEFLRELGIL